VTLCLQLYRNQHESVLRPLQVGSPFISAYCYGPAHVRPKAPRDCLFQGQQVEAWFSPHYAGPLPAVAATIVASSPGSESHVLRQCSKHRIRLTSYQDISNNLQAACYHVYSIAMQGLLPHTAVTALHSSTTHHYPSLTLAAPKPSTLARRQNAVRCGTTFPA
jgi:hypothetical protein